MTTQTKPAGYLYDWIDEHSGNIVKSWFTRDKNEIATAHKAHNIVPLYERTNPKSQPAHKLNHTGTCAVSTDRHWMAVTDTAPPVGVKCNLLTRYGVAIIGVVTASNRPDFAGWEPLARVPWGMLDVCHLATRQAEIYSGLISKIDARHVPTN